MSRKEAVLVPSLVALLVIVSAAAEIPHVSVAQKGRAFNPGSIVVATGDTVRIINDDGDLIHHAYVASDAFSFDSGDQEPGSKTDVVFSVAGKFVVRCGIHPKMRLDVEVR